MKKLRSGFGITLIVLTITIIVLLILAGTIIQFLIGEDSIIGKTKDSVSENQKATAKEEIELAIAQLRADYYIEGIGSVQTIEDYVEEHLEAGVDTIDGSIILENGFIIYRNSKGEKLYKGIYDNIIGKFDFFEDKITPESYGDIVDYGIDLNGNGISDDWKIFYANGNDVFLIASDFVLKNDTLLKLDDLGMGQSGSNQYSLYWDSYKVPSNLQPTSQNALFQANGYTLKNENISSRVVSTLLNTNNWDNYVITGADYAIGSPTIEMWIASWNKSYPEDLLYCNNTNENGYYVGINREQTRYDLYDSDMKNKDGYNNSLYYPSKEGNKNYWLASPAAYSSDTYVRIIRATGGLGYVYYSAYNCLRPVVHLSSDITKNEVSGMWEF